MSTRGWSATRTLLGVLATGALLAGPAAAQVRVQASASADTVGLDETIEYRVSVSGAGLRDVDEPELALPLGLTLFGTSRSSEVSIVNGSVERRTRFTLVYRPFRLGTFAIGPATVRVGGARYTAPPVGVTVVEARSPTAIGPPLPGGERESLRPEEEGESGLPPVFVTNRLDRDEVYAGEQVILTFAFYQSSRAMVLDQPNYSSARTPGFWMQDLNREPDITRELIGGEPYTIQRFYYALFPLTPGTKEIAPATLTLTLRDLGSFFERGRTRTLTADTLHLKVLPLPEEGRPPGFEGAIGRYRLEARLEPRELERDSPATLVLAVSGQGNVATVPPPRLPPIPGVMVFDPEVKTRVTPRRMGVEGAKEFRYLVVPKRQGTLDLGAASLAYFDPRAGEYREATARLGGLVVRGPGAPPKLGARAGGQELAAIREGPVGGSTRQPWRSPLYWTLAALPVVGLALLATWRRRPHRPSRRSPARLVVATELRRDPSPASVARVERELVAYLEARHGVALRGQSVAARERALREAGVPEEIAARAGTALQALEAVGFAPPEARAAALEDAVEALRRLEGAERPARGRSTVRA